MTRWTDGPLSHSLDNLSSSWASISFTQKTVKFIGQAHLLDKLSSEWACVPLTKQIVERIGFAHLLDELLSEWTGLYTRHFIERMGLCPIHSTIYRVIEPGQ